MNDWEGRSWNKKGNIMEWKHQQNLDAGRGVRKLEDPGMAAKLLARMVGWTSAALMGLRHGESQSGEGEGGEFSFWCVILEVSVERSRSSAWQGVIRLNMKERSEVEIHLEIFNTEVNDKVQHSGWDHLQQRSASSFKPATKAGMGDERCQERDGCDEGKKKKYEKKNK